MRKRFQAIRSTKLQRETEGYLEMGMPRHALGSLARLGDPTRLGPHPLYLWGEALRMIGRYEEALVPLLQASEADPENVSVWLAVGWCNKRTGRLHSAIDALDHALRAAPDDPLVHYNLACYWSLAGNKQQAIRHLASSLAAEPSYGKLIDDEPDFDPIRSDPDFRAVCEGVELADS